MPPDKRMQCFCIESVWKTVPFWKVAPKRCPKRYRFADNQTVLIKLIFSECIIIMLFHVLWLRPYVLDVLQIFMSSLAAHLYNISIINYNKTSAYSSIQIVKGHNYMELSPFPILDATVG